MAQALVAMMTSARPAAGMAHLPLVALAGQAVEVAAVPHVAQALEGQAFEVAAACTVDVQSLAPKQVVIFHVGGTRLVYRRQVHRTPTLLETISLA